LKADRHGDGLVDLPLDYIYPEQYEGRECDPLIFCTGPVPAQQLDPLILAQLAATERGRPLR
jgi:hypothetical protein